ncbi:carbonic anhydrase 12 isoform X2 [Thunnus albacares]|nr:carbonic anhydrase 12 isoform X2 [Thunnus maccoyii]XP_042266901.1 carbonic anhydrase 12 isoform X2 [Thunnus maccoyii]XP_044213669.1 carbonic anhydrase 12 isoform X2 [Thunnus albacares]XP_044213670.1 carbonic anhydrase 12 isoform X2 [Thunnus albacares]
MRFDPTLRPIEVHGYNLSRNEQLTLGNNGHSVQISLPSKMHISSFPHRYTAAQLHFHWGSFNRPAGSEHMVNSKQYAAEMHVVHFNSDKYPNMSMAVDKSDGLAVLGVLIEVGQFNPAFEQFLKFINGIKYRDQKVQVPGFNIRSLLPARLDEYYRYDGSLTTPPCYPSVLWTVFRNHVTISRKQFLSLATALYSSHAQDSAPVPLSGNYRKPQLADTRVVLVSFKEGRGLHGSLTYTSSFKRKRIIQQLLVGDLADLADEGLYKLLPSGSEKLYAGRKKYPKNQKSGTLAKSKQQTLHPSLRKKSQPTNRSVGKLGLGENELCYVSLEQRVFHQLRQSHRENQLVQALRDAVFPELNLRSYLNCKSDLALPTIRHILRGRPTDEAFELDRSLTKALMNPKKTTAIKQSVPKTNYGSLSPATVPRKPHSHGYPHPWLLPMEWED